MTSAALPTATIETLLLRELHLLAADQTDTNVQESLRLAKQLDAEDLEPQAAKVVARQLNARLLALQHAYWRTPSLPAPLSRAMHERAAAVHARLAEKRPSRPASTSPAEMEQAFLDAYRQRDELKRLEATEALADESS